MHAAILEQILDGQKIGEADETTCTTCGKRLHGGEDVTAEVEVNGDVARLSRVNCGSCDDADLHGDVARARTGTLGEHAKQKHYLVVLQPRVHRRTEAV